jgi:SP family arabinose:H+ symporter-like MFS transporter
MSLAFGVSWMLLGPHGVDWRGAMLIGVLLPIIAASMIPWSFTPESPRYHRLCGRVEEARTSMEKLGISDEEAEQTIQAWISSGNAESPGTLQDLRIHLKPLALAIVFSASTQLTGIIALHNLMPWVLASRLPEEEALRCATIISALKFAILIPVCFWLLDQVGRRPLLCASSFMFATSSVFTAAAFMNGSSGEVVAIGYGCILCSFSAGIGPATWPYIAELLPTPIRAYGTGIALMFGRVISMLWMFFFPVLFARKPELPLWMIAVFSTAAFIFYVAMCPETTQKTLENIQQSWEKQVVSA